MSIFEQSIRSLDSCDEALEHETCDDNRLHRVCSQETLDDLDDNQEEPICYSTDDLLAASSMKLRPFKSNLTMEGGLTSEGSDSEDGLGGSREKMLNYEVNCFSDSEDDDDVYEPDWKVYEDFKGGVIEDQLDDVVPLSESKWMQSTDKLAMDAVADDWDVNRRLARKRHYRLGHMSSDLEDLVKQLEVIPAKFRRLDEEGNGRNERME